MTKLHLPIISLLILSSAHAQMSFPSPSENPLWIESHGMLYACSTTGLHGLCDGYYCGCTKPVYYKSDTTINDTIYNRLYTYGICNAIYALGPPTDGCPYSFSYQNPEVLFATIRQDTLNKIVYVRDNNRDIVLYDFKNIIVGQDYPKTYNSHALDTLVIVAEDSLLSNNRYIKKWDLGIKIDGYVTDSGFVSIIEGIGSTFGILAELMLPFENSDELICFSINDTVLYPDSSYNCDKPVNINTISAHKTFSVYPNPATNILTIETSHLYKGEGVLKVFNTNGLEILEKQMSDKITKINISALSKGVYIVQFVNAKTIEIAKFIKE